MEMKIKVHEIEGAHYCAVDDITVAVSKATGKSRTRERCLADLIQDYKVFLFHKEAYFFQHGDGFEEDDFKPIPSGFYSVDEWKYPCEDSGCGWEWNPVTFEKIPPEKPCAGHTSPSNLNRIPLIQVNHIDSPAGTVEFLQRNAIHKDRYLGIHPSPSDCYIALIDAKIYLADIATDDDFIMPQTTTPKDELATEAEQLTANTKRLTNEPPLGEKERGNLYRIIHAMKDILLDESTKDSEGKQLFISQNKLIECLADRYNGYSGLKTSNLKQLCAKLNKELSEAEKTFNNS